MKEMVEPEERRQPLGTRAAWWAAALIPLLLGFVLRLRYVLGAEPFVDEPTTLLVGRAIASSGLPTLPSGLFYGNDLPFSYLSGGLVALFGPHLEVLRALSLAASLVTIGVVSYVGRRLFSPWTGLWAGLLLALSAEAILWGGRARAYALLGLLALLAAWLFYEGLAHARDGLRRLGWLLLVVAAFVHPEAALLLPAFVLGAVLLQGWRWWLRPDRLVELILATAGVAARYWLQLALAQGWFGGFQTATGSRPPLELAGDWLSRLAGVAPFFLDPQRLPWTLLALLAVAVAVWAVVTQAKGKAAAQAQPPGKGRPALFFSLCLWLVPVEMVLLLGSTYQSPRYLTLLLPLFALLAAFGLDWLVGRLVAQDRPGRWRLVLSGLTTALLLAAFLPGAAAAANSREKGFRSALEYVGQHWQPGDQVATVAPAYGQLVLGRSDYFTLGVDYEEFVYRAGDGQWVDRWLGSPLVRSAEELAVALDGGGRLWFVTDEGRLRKRFDPAFAQLVWERMELVAKTDQVMVFVSYPPQEPAVSRALKATFGGQIALVGYDLGLADQRLAEAGQGEIGVEPGRTLPLTFYWQAVAPVMAEYTVFLHLVGPAGQVYAQDGPPLRGLQPMAHWQRGEILPDRRVLALPEDLEPGRYRLEVGLYLPDGGDRLPVVDATGQPLGQALSLDAVQVLGQDQVLPVPAQPLQVDFAGNGDRVRLLGYDLPEDTAVAGGTLGLTLYWQALVPLGTDYTVFVHLLDGEDRIRGQRDGPPVGGFYPTSLWDPGEIVVDEHQVSIDGDAPAGTYRLAVGLYMLSTGQRLATGEGDRVVVAEVRVE